MKPSAVSIGLAGIERLRRGEYAGIGISPLYVQRTAAELKYEESGGVSPVALRQRTGRKKSERTCGGSTDYDGRVGRVKGAVRMRDRRMRQESKVEGSDVRCATEEPEGSWRTFSASCQRGSGDGRMGHRAGNRRGVCPTFCKSKKLASRPPGRAKCWKRN